MAEFLHSKRAMVGCVIAATTAFEEAWLAHVHGKSALMANLKRLKNFLFLAFTRLSQLPCIDACWDRKLGSAVLEINLL